MVDTQIKGMSLDELLTKIESGRNGLSSDEARRRLARHGSNDPGDTPRGHWLALLVTPFFNPMSLILLLSSGVSMALGDVSGAAIIAAMVLLSGGLNIVISYRSQRAAARLREEVVPTATVRRDGVWQELPRRQLVPGDLIRLSAGDRVPADARLLDARDLHVQQSALTGESAPVEKEAVEEAVVETGADARGSVFLGTSVVAGTAQAIVVATGRNTAFGGITESLVEKPPPTAFELGLERFAKFIMRTVLFLVLFVLLASLAMGRPAFQSLLFAVALAVGLTPEFMPMITTVTLARGAVRMAKRRVIVRHLAAIDDFGSMDILLSDKTGTLTSGEMTFDASVDSKGVANDRPKHLAWLNSHHQTGIRSPLDTAILAQSPAGDAKAYRKLDEFPFDFVRRRLTVVVENEERTLLIAKGAPEFVLQECTRYESGGALHDFDEASRAACLALQQDMGERGLRVLAVAWREIEHKPRYSIEEENNLVLAGFVSFLDPPLPEVSEVMAALARDGLKVKILSGDGERVVRHVCTQVGLNVERIVRGEELDGMDESALAVLAEQHDVFARMLPAHKHRIVLALKQRGHVVGFLGDGINDAPSLHAADVGISVSNAIDVAKDAADIILRERKLDVLHDGVIEGRRAFANVMKYLLMGTSSNFGNVFSMAAGVLFLPFLPMLPTQILLNNFLYDLAQVTIPTDNVDAEQLTQPRHWDIRLVRDFMLWLGPISSVYDLLTFAMLLSWLHASETVFHTGWFIESLATQTLVLFVIRTTGNPLRSRPSLPLTASVLIVVMLAFVVPWMPWASKWGFAPLPPVFFAFLAVVALSYLLIVEWAKRRLFERAGFASH
jgi:Mg2+-importing ATPase